MADVVTPIIGLPSGDGIVSTNLSFMVLALGGPHIIPNHSHYQATITSPQFSQYIPTFDDA